MKVCQSCQLEWSEEDVFCSNCGSRLASAVVVAAAPPPPPHHPTTLPITTITSDDSPREVLHFLLHKHPECVKSLSLLLGLLTDYLANAKAERFLLCLIAEKGIPERLQKADILNAHLFGSLSDILISQCFIQPEMAREGILIWANALDKEIATELQPYVLAPVKSQVLSLPLSEGIAMELVWCPPGLFMMGSPEGELGRCDREAQHQVTLTKGFWIGKYAVTQEQYVAVIGSNPSELIGSRRPVESISWDEAMSFCSRVQLPTDGSIPIGYKLTLPSEAQWEYACRAGTTSALNNGLELSSNDGECANLAHVVDDENSDIDDSLDDSLGNNEGLSQVGWYCKNCGSETHEVGQKSPNAWGLYDMHGNVWEWCLDWYDSYDGAVIDPTGPYIGANRVFRGGSWFSGAYFCRSAYRDSISSSSRSSDIGMRLVLVPD